METTEQQLRRENEELKRQLQRAAAPGSAVTPPTRYGIPRPSRSGPSAAGVTVLPRRGVFRRLHPASEARRADPRRKPVNSEKALPRVEVIRWSAPRRKSELDLAGQHPGCHRSPHSGPRRRLHQDAGWWTSAIACRPASSWRRSRRRNSTSRCARPRPIAPDAGRAGPGARQPASKAKRTRNWLESRPSVGQTLAGKGVVSQQENDQYQAQYQAQVANLEALEKAVAAQRSNVAAAEANLARLDESRATAW